MGEAEAEAPHPEQPRLEHQQLILVSPPPPLTTNQLMSAFRVSAPPLRTTNPSVPWHFQISWMPWDNGCTKKAPLLYATPSAQSVLRFGQAPTSFFYLVCGADIILRDVVTWTATPANGWQAPHPAGAPPTPVTISSPPHWEPGAQVQWAPTSAFNRSPAGGVCLSLGSEPFPSKIVDKVVSGAYVDMKELLRDNITAAATGETEWGGHFSGTTRVYEVKTQGDIFANFVALLLPGVYSPSLPR